MKLQHEMENKSLPEISIGNTQQGDSLRFTDIFKGNNATICFRFKESHCDACVQNGMMLLNQVCKQSGQRIVVLCSFVNSHQFLAFSKSQNKLMSLYNIDHLPWVADKIEEPYFFIVTEGKKIHNFFVPIKEKEELTHTYIHALLHKYGM